MERFYRWMRQAIEMISWAISTASCRFRHEILFLNTFLWKIPCPKFYSTYDIWLKIYAGRCKRRCRRFLHGVTLVWILLGCSCTSHEPLTFVSGSVVGRRVVCWSPNLTCEVDVTIRVHLECSSHHWIWFAEPKRQIVTAVHFRLISWYFV